MSPSLADYGIGLNCNPPKDEPGNKYEMIGTGQYPHADALNLAIQYRKTHPKEPVEVWPTDGDMRLVVREII